MQYFNVGCEINNNKQNYDVCLQNLCFSIYDNNIILDYTYFKHIACSKTYDLIVDYIINTILHVKKTHELFRIHINLKGVSLANIDTHYSFISKLAIKMKETFPDRLDVCYIYNAPFIFSQLLSLVSCFIDKKTQQKIKLV
jgi:hypothetical protein